MADNTLHITIDPSGAVNGARQTINALNSIVNVSNQLNMQINITNNKLDSLGSSANKASGIIDKLRKGWILFKSSMLLSIPLTILDSFIDKMISVDRSYQNFMASMYVSTSSTKKSAEAFEFVSKVARAYGVELESISKSYAKFRAAVSSSLPTAAADKLFLSISAVSSVLHLTPQSVDRIFTAFTQMASKGQVMSEELKQQLGEHLPGAVALAAQAMGVTVKELTKMMKDGAVDINKFFLNMPDVIMKKFSEAAKISSMSIIAQINNLKSTIFRNMVELNNSGASLGLAKFIQSIDNILQPTTKQFKAFGSVVGQAFLDASKFINSLSPEEVAEFATQLVEAVGALIQLVKWLTQATVFAVKNHEVITDLIVAYIGLKVAMWGVATASAGSAAGAGIASKSLGILGRMVAIVSALFIGWKIGEILKEKFQIVDTFGIELSRRLYHIVEGSINGMSTAFTIGSAFIRKFAEVTVGTLVRLRNFIGQFVPGMSISVEAPDFGSDKTFEEAQKKLLNMGKARDETNQYFDALRVDSASKHRKKTDTSEIDKYSAEMKTQLEMQEKLRGEYAALSAKAAEEMASLPANNDAAAKAAKKAAAAAAKSTREYLGLMDEVISTYKTEYSAKITEIENLVKAEDISPEEGFRRETEALKKYSSAVLSELTEASNTRNLSAKQREDINGKILKAEMFYLNESKKIRIEAAKDFKDYTNSIIDFEEASGIVRLSNLDKFALDWTNKNKKLLDRAKLDGNTVFADRIQKAAEYGVAKSTYTPNDNVGYSSDNAAYDLMKDKNKLFVLDTKTTLAATRGEYEEYFRQLRVLKKEGTVDEVQATKIHNELMVSRSKAIRDAAVTVAKSRLELGIDSNLNSMVVLLDNISNGFIDLKTSATQAFIEIGKSLTDEITTNISGAITGAKTLQEAFSDIATTILDQVIQAIIQMGIRWAATTAMNSLLGKASAAESAATAATTGASITASMATAAATTSLATMGSNTITASTGMLAFGALMAAMLGGLLAGAFDNGGYIPDGKLGIVGEYGPEIVQGPVAVTGRKNTESIIRSAAGSSNSQTSGNTVVNIDVAVHVSDSGTQVDTSATGLNAQMAKQMGNQMAQVAKKVVIDAFSQGGFMYGRK